MELGKSLSWAIKDSFDDIPKPYENIMGKAYETLVIHSVNNSLRNIDYAIYKNLFESNNPRYL